MTRVPGRAHGYRTVFRRTNLAPCNLFAEKQRRPICPVTPEDKVRALGLFRFELEQKAALTK